MGLAFFAAGLFELPWVRLFFRELSCRELVSFVVGLFRVAVSRLYKGA